MSERKNETEVKEADLEVRSMPALKEVMIPEKGHKDKLDLFGIHRVGD